MAINVTVMDLENFPGIEKRVTIDQEQFVPYGNEGDEQFLISFSTTAYSNNTSRTAIQDLYVSSFKVGWCKSSGFKGTTFELDSTHCSLEIKMDSTTSGIDSGYYRITLDHDNGVGISGEVIAADMETKIRAIADTLGTADIGHKLAFMNSSVEFIAGKFWIVSGSVGQYYTGSNKSAVRVRPALVNDCSTILGFDLSVSTEELDGIEIKEALVTTTFSGSTTSGTTYIDIDRSIGASAYDCMMITDNSNTDYFQITSMVGNTRLYFNADNISNDYEASSTKVQLLREQDPDADPTLWFTNIDAIIRHGLKVMINQIDFSS